jgi:methionine-R-sulfoxide reductase
MLRWDDVVRFANQGNPLSDHMVRKSEEEWRAQLTPEQYRVARGKGTERAFNSQMCDLFEPGLYACVCCGTKLFDSSEKYQSGTGWPSFSQSFTPNAVAYHHDDSYGMQRIETTCNTCESHLGHVFPDGPEPSGLRYCINAVVLEKVTKGAE